MKDDPEVKAAIEFIRQQPREYKERDWYARVRTPETRTQEVGRDWSGSSAAGREWSGSRWGGGREI